MDRISFIAPNTTSQPVVSTTSNDGVVLTVSKYPGYATYTLVNKTNEIQYVSLLRYYSYDKQTIGYYFGGAFGFSNYVALGVPLYGSTTKATTYISMITNGNGITPAFVFELQPNQTYSINEYGFANTTSYQLIITPIVLQTAEFQMFFVAYNELLPIEYSLEVGTREPQTPNPDIVTTALFTFSSKYPMINMGYYVAPIVSNSIFGAFVEKLDKLLIDLSNVLQKLIIKL